MRVFGPNELVADVFQRDLCIGCGACTELCPYLRNHRGKTGMLFSCTRTQGRCYAHCPKAEVDLDALSTLMFNAPYEGTPIGIHRKLLTAKAGARVTAGRFQAGGVVSALVTYALKAGLIDAAVLTDREGLIPVSHLVTNPEEVAKFASTKYMAAPTVAMVNKGQQQGYKRMGIVGTPCQLTAVAKIRANPLQKEEFADPIGLAIGLFCTWSLDTRRLLAFVTDKVDVDRIHKMDIPPPPAEIMVVETDQGRLEFALSQIRSLVPNSCSICPDLSAELSDLSVGVLEGRPNLNTLIIRTPKGEDLARNAERDGFLITAEMPSENFEHLCFAAGNKKRRAFQQLRERDLVNTDGGKRAAVRVNGSTLDRIGAE